jgi:hypothetical protein
LTKTVGTNGFETREFYVTTEEQYPQILSIQFTQGRVSLLDGFEAGDKVKIDLNLKVASGQIPKAIGLF